MPLQRPNDPGHCGRTGTGPSAPACTEGTIAGVVEALRRDGFAYLPVSEMRRMIGGVEPARWAAFTRSWDGLEIDRFMNDGGTYRRRRHAVFSADGADLVRRPDRPHFQEVAFNRLNGGVSRAFAPVAREISDLPLTRAIVAAFLPVFEASPPRPHRPVWDIEMHQFRIEADRERQGLPTPEGVHRDGVDWVVMVMVDRTNVSGGLTTIEGAGGTPLSQFLMANPLDAVVLDDRRLRHGASAISAVQHEAPAHRDMLVLTYRGR